MELNFSSTLLAASFGPRTAMILNIVLLFLAGAFLCNCIPHVVAGLLGMPFPTPFAKPPGKGNSPPMTNFIWGSINLFVGIGFLLLAAPVLTSIFGLIALAVGFVVAGGSISMHFGKVRNRAR